LNGCSGPTCAKNDEYAIRISHGRWKCCWSTFCITCLLGILSVPDNRCTDQGKKLPVIRRRLVCISSSLVNYMRKCDTVMEKLKFFISANHFFPLIKMCSADWEFESNLALVNRAFPVRKKDSIPLAKVTGLDWDKNNKPTHTVKAIVQIHFFLFFTFKS